MMQAKTTKVRKRRVNKTKAARTRKAAPKKAKKIHTYYDPKESHSRARIEHGERAENELAEHLRSHFGFVVKRTSTTSYDYTISVSGIPMYADCKKPLPKNYDTGKFSVSESTIIKATRIEGLTGDASAEYLPHIVMVPDPRTSGIGEVRWVHTPDIALSVRYGTPKYPIHTKYYQEQGGGYKYRLVPFNDARPVSELYQFLLDWHINAGNQALLPSGLCNGIS